MKDPFSPVFKTNKIEITNSQLELFKKNPEEFYKKLERDLPNKHDVKSEISKLLNEIGISLTDRSPEGRTYSTYDSKYLKDLLKKELGLKEEVETEAA
jgi:hypothetical protein